MIPTKAFVGAENGLFKKCRVQGWEGWQFMPGHKPDVECDLPGSAH